MGRSPCCSKEGLNRGAWTAPEDKILKEYIRVHGEGRWRNLPKKAGLKRCGKSCRLRWLNYLRPNIKRGNISSDEEELIIRLHKLLGNRWSLIAGRLPGRTDNEIKNYWNTKLGKKVRDHKQTNTSSGRRFAGQPNGKSSENPKAPTQSTPSPSPSPPAPPKIESHAVRTKATKCSKLLLINPPVSHSSSMQLLQNKSNADAEEARPLIVDAASKANADSISNNQIEPSSVYDNGFLSFLSEDHKEVSADLLIDYNVGDVCLSDLLNSDFSNVFDFGCNNNDELLAPCSDQPALFSDEILKDWTHSNFVGDTNVSINLHCLGSND